MAGETVALMFFCERPGDTGGNSHELCTDTISIDTMPSGRWLAGQVRPAPGPLPPARHSLAPRPQPAQLHATEH